MRVRLEALDVLLENTPAEALIADKAYDAYARVIGPLLKAGKTVVIPPRSTRKDQRDYDRHLYTARHLIENFFARLKEPVRCAHIAYSEASKSPAAPHLGPSELGRVNTT